METKYVHLIEETSLFPTPTYLNGTSPIEFDFTQNSAMITDDMTDIRKDA